MRQVGRYSCDIKIGKKLQTSAKTVPSVLAEASLRCLKRHPNWRAPKGAVCASCHAEVIGRPTETPAVVDADTKRIPALAGYLLGSNAQLAFIAGASTVMVELARLEAVCWLPLMLLQKTISCLPD